jgi:hypothetical protein
MDLAGIVMDFFGALMLGFCAQFGTVTVYSGNHVPKGRLWRITNIAGWILVCDGFLFLLQAIAAWRG